MADCVALVHATDANARALLTDDELRGSLCRLTSLIADVLGADGAGVLLARHGDTLTPVAATGGSTTGVHERLAAVPGGPCVEASRSGTPVVVADMAQDDGRWPLHRAAALEAGIAAMMCMPLMARTDECLGVLAIYRTACHDWHDAELTTAREIAAVASVHIEKQDELDRANTLAAQLQRALDRRVVIEQAKGVLIERHHLSPDEAFEQLRSKARNSRRRVHDVAADLVEDARAGARDQPWLRAPTDGRAS